MEVLEEEGPIKLRPDVRNFLVRGGYLSQNGTALQNLMESMNWSTQPLPDFTIGTEGRVSLTTGMIHTSATVNQIVAITALQRVNGEVVLQTSPQGAALTMEAPVQVSIDAATEVLTAADTDRRYWGVTNNGSNRVSLGFGAAAVLDSGITLQPNGGSFEMSEAQGNLFTGAINAIASAAATLVGTQTGT